MGLKATARENFLGFMDAAARAMVRRMASDVADTRYIEDNEIELIDEGMAGGLLSVDGNRISLLGSEGRMYDLFTLNREYLTQFAAFVSLVKRYGYAVADCRFEFHFMDICVFRNEKPYIYVETKVAERPTELLLEKILAYAPKIGLLLGEHDRGNDALRKAKYIFNDKPEYLWLVTPKKRRAFRVSYTNEGFALDSIDDIPSATRTDTRIAGD